MKLVMHIGMPKSGSTSIQNELFERAAGLRAQFGFYYQPDNDRFRNHWLCAQLVNAHSDLPALVDLLKAQIRLAMENACRTVCLSSEDLIFLLESEEKIAFLSEGLAQVGIAPSAVRYVMVYRQLEDFTRSYLKQLVSNGQSLANPDYLNLCAFFVKLMRRFFSLDGERLALSLDAMKIGAGLVNVLFREITGTGVAGSERFDNSWGARTFLSELLCGQLVGLHAVNRRLHPNEERSDAYRRRLRSLIDGTAANPDVGQLFADLDTEIDVEVNELITQNLARLDPADSALLQSLYSADLIRLPIGQMPPWAE